MRVRITEHKTSTEDITPGSAYWQKLTLDGQLSAYYVGARSLGYEPVDVLYDVAKRPGQKPYKATPEEDREYTKMSDRACKECKKKSPAPLPHTETVGKDDEAREVACVDGRIVTDSGGKLYANMRAADETVEEHRLRVRADIQANPEKYYQRGRIVRMEKEERAAAKNTWILARWIREVQLDGRDDPEAWPQNVDACHTYGNACDFWGVCSGSLSLDDPHRFTRVDAQHTELSNDDDGKRHLPLITMSSMKTFRSCPRKYYLRYEMGYRTVATSEALRFGTLFHLGLETWWQTVDIDAAIAAMRKGVAADAYELVRAEELMLGYHFKWEDEPLTVLAVEAEFRAPLINPATGAESKTWTLGGKIDAIVAAA